MINTKNLKRLYSRGFFCFALCAAFAATHPSKGENEIKQNPNSIMSTTIPKFYQVLNEVAVGHSPADQALEALEIVSRSKPWSFGAGLGPTDITSLKCEAIEVIWPLRGKLDVSRLTGDAKLIMERVSKAAEDVEYVFDLLGDKDPLMRLIAMLKMQENSARLTEKQKDALRAVAESDGFFLIRRVELPDIDSKLPPQLHNTENRIIAPLRERALLILRGKQLSETPESKVSDSESARWLAQIALSSSQHAEDVRYALQLLRGKGEKLMLLETILSANINDTERVKEIASDTQ